MFPAVSSWCLAAACEISAGFPAAGTVRSLMIERAASVTPDEPWHFILCPCVDYWDACHFPHFSMRTQLRCAQVFWTFWRHNHNLANSEDGYRIEEHFHGIIKGITTSENRPNTREPLVDYREAWLWGIIRLFGDHPPRCIGFLTLSWLCSRLKQYASLETCVQDNTEESPINNEVAMLQHLGKFAQEADHLGLDFTCLAQDIFKIDGPSGPHNCIVTNPQGPSLCTLQETLPGARLPKLLIRSLIHWLLFSINELHATCGVIHTGMLIW